jgi:hypothetical protein
MSNIIPIEGLCNRLRVILSYLNSYPTLNIYWENDKTVNNQHFLDIFQPIPNFNFLPSKPTSYIYKGYSHCLPIDNFKNNYLLLKPTKEILLKIKEFISILGTDYDACHIRRTDHTRLAISHKCLTTDLQFINFIQKSTKSKIFIATDNIFTQISLKKLFHNKIIINHGINNTKNLRKSNLETALIDLILCSKSKHFIGSGYSSFTSTIDTLKKINYFDTIIQPLLNDLDK